MESSEKNGGDKLSKSVRLDTMLDSRGFESVLASLRSGSVQIHAIAQIHKNKYSAWHSHGTYHNLPISRKQVRVYSHSDLLLFWWGRVDLNHRRLRQQIYSS